MFESHLLINFSYYLWGKCEYICWELHRVHLKLDSLKKTIVLPGVGNIWIFLKWSRSVNQDFARRVTMKWRASWVSTFFPLPMHMCQDLAKVNLCWITVVSFRVSYLTFWKQKEISMSWSSLLISQNEVLAQPDSCPSALV